MSFEMYYSSSGARYPVMQAKLTLVLATASGWHGISAETFSAIQEILKLYPRVPFMGIISEFPMAVATYINEENYNGYVFRFGYSMDTDTRGNWKCFFQIGVEKAIQIGPTPLREMVQLHSLDATVSLGGRDKVSSVALGCKGYGCNSLV